MVGHLRWGHADFLTDCPKEGLVRRQDRRVGESESDGVIGVPGSLLTGPGGHDDH